jgi:nucleotide-binding universal stress UspA family protein
MDPVIPAAAALSQSTGLPLEVMHAFDLSDPFVEHYLRHSAIPGDPLQHYVEGLQARLEGQVGGLGLTGKVVCSAAAGVPAAVLSRAAADSDTLLVVGPTHRGRFGSAVLGTTVQRVLQECTAPVLVLRGGGPVASRVLYCLDLASPHAATTLVRGSGIVESLSPGEPASRVLAVIRLELEFPIPEIHERLAPGAMHRLEGLLAEHPSSGALEPHVRTGKPAAEIVSEAAEWEADLIVVGSHGRSRATRLILGSVAEAVMRDAPCSVLVIPPSLAAGEG